MPTYVSLLKWTEQGAKNARESTKRAEEAKAAVRKLGGKLTTILWTQGSYDAVAITDFPNEDSAMAFLIGIAGAGNVRTETLRAYSASHMERIFAKMAGSSPSAGAGGGSAKGGSSKR